MLLPRRPSDAYCKSQGPLRTQGTDASPTSRSSQTSLLAERCDYTRAERGCLRPVERYEPVPGLRRNAARLVLSCIRFQIPLAGREFDPPQVMSKLGGCTLILEVPKQSRARTATAEDYRGCPNTHRQLTIVNFDGDFREQKRWRDRLRAPERVGPRSRSFSRSR